MSSETKSDMYDWERCDHRGIGNIGCPICDPDKGRVMIRQQRMDNRDLRHFLKEAEAELAAERAAHEAVKKQLSVEQSARIADHRAERDAARVAEAQVERLREALDAAAKSLESASAHYKVDDDNVRAYCLSRATVARAALAATQDAAPTVLPFVPWSKEAEMRESWRDAAPNRDAEATVSFMVRTWNLTENGHTDGDTLRFEALLVEARAALASTDALDWHRAEVRAAMGRVREACAKWVDDNCREIDGSELRAFYLDALMEKP